MILSLFFLPIILINVTGVLDSVVINNWPLRTIVRCELQKGLMTPLAKTAMEEIVECKKHFSAKGFYPESCPVTYGFFGSRARVHTYKYPLDWFEGFGWYVSAFLFQFFIDLNEEILVPVMLMNPSEYMFLVIPGNVEIFELCWAGREIK